MVVTSHHNNPIDFISSSQKVEVNVNKSTKFVSHNQHSQENSWCLLIKKKHKREKEDPKPQDKEPPRKGERPKMENPKKKG
jgi:hypothetical protein